MCRSRPSAPTASKPPAPNRGADAERCAAHYLQQHGLVLLAQNVHYRQGELDLVMEHGDNLVFVEVRLRRGSRFGGAIGSVTVTKQRRIIGAARQYLAAHPTLAERPCRFDLVALDEDHRGHRRIQWLQAAFDTCIPDPKREWT